jgi:hypothetical protein
VLELQLLNTNAHWPHQKINDTRITSLTDHLFFSFFVFSWPFVISDMLFSYLHTTTPPSNIPPSKFPQLSPLLFSLLPFPDTTMYTEAGGLTIEL